VVVDPDPRIDPLVWLELRRALSKRPYERPATATAMAQQLLAASGQTEATLAEALRNAPLSEGLAEEAQDSARRRGGTEGGHSLPGPDASIGRRRRALAWVATAFFACTLLVIAGSSARKRTLAAPAPVAPTEAPPPSASPVVAVVEPSSSVASPAPSASATLAAPSAPVRPARTPRRKSVATTPGF
jgi:hypothetical protein